METAFNKTISNDTKKAKVKVIRSRRETKLIFVFRGGLEETEGNLQKVYKAVIS